MDPSYEFVVNVWDLVWTMAVYVLHGVVIAAQASLALYLVWTGVANLLRPERDALGAVRAVLGLLVLAPLAGGAPMLVSLVAVLAALAILIAAGRSAPEGERPGGRRVRRAAIGCAALAGLFMLWEREDNLALGADLLLHGMQWRQDELDWQLSQDPKSPKVGDVAPDFELQDPEGRAVVRLSDFRGKRPVALVFGSYT